MNGDEIELIDNLEAGNESNPEHIILDRENTMNIEDILKEHLSPMEKQVLSLYMQGNSYADIGLELGKSSKSIDNSIQRIRDKVKKLYKR